MNLLISHRPAEYSLSFLLFGVFLLVYRLPLWLGSARFYVKALLATGGGGKRQQLDDNCCDSADWPPIYR